MSGSHFSPESNGSLENHQWLTRWGQLLWHSVDSWRQVPIRRLIWRRSERIVREDRSSLVVYSYKGGCQASISPSGKFRKCFCLGIQPPRLMGHPRGWGVLVRACGPGWLPRPKREALFSPWNSILPSRRRRSVSKLASVSVAELPTMVLLETRGL